MAQRTGGGRGMVCLIAGGCQQGVEASAVKTLEGVLVAVGVQMGVGGAVEVSESSSSGTGPFLQLQGRAGLRRYRSTKEITSLATSGLAHPSPDSVRSQAGARAETPLDQSKFNAPTADLPR